MGIELIHQGQIPIGAWHTAGGAGEKTECPVLTFLQSLQERNNRAAVQLMLELEESAARGLTDREKCRLLRGDIYEMRAAGAARICCFWGGRRADDARLTETPPEQRPIICTHGYFDSDDAWCEDCFDDGELEVAREIRAQCLSGQRQPLWNKPDAERRSKDTRGLRENLTRSTFEPRRHSRPMPQPIPRLLIV